MSLFDDRMETRTADKAQAHAAQRQELKSRCIV